MIRLHHAHGTRSERVLWLLHELQVPFEVKVWPFDKTLRSGAYAAIHPVGRVPALEVEGATLIESGAMIEHLCDLHPASGLGRQSGHPERAKWLQWLHFAETISQHVAALTQQHIMLYEDHQRSPLVMRLEAKRLERCFAFVEAALSDGRSELLAGGFSAADVAVGQAVTMGRHFARIEGMPSLALWHARLRSRPAFQAAAPPDGEGPYAQEFYPPWPDQAT